jgi:hypothetical protein
MIAKAESIKTSLSSPRVRVHAASGLALLEVLVGTMVLSVFLLAATPAWRVLDYQLLVDRLTERAARVLRQANDFILYAPYDSLPADGSTVFSGWLYQPGNATSSEYKKLLPYTVTAAVTVQNAGTPDEAKQIRLTLNYQFPQLNSNAPKAQIIQTQEATRERF